MSAPTSRLLGLDDTELDADSFVDQVILGRYEIVRFIGAGGMGTVYEARHQRIGRRMAVKFLRRGLAGDRKTLARFEQEATAAGALESENICAIVDVGATPEGVPCLVMEYIDGENLAVLLDGEGPLPVPRAVDLVCQVCRGLRVAHAAHVVHRDLKPRNLIVCRHSDATDLVKIVDFGIAKLGAERGAAMATTTTGSAPGTPHYMSPEQARGEKRIDVRVDIYALGVILYELLTGHKPHTGDSYNAIIYNILSKEPVPLRERRADVPSGLAVVVHRAMAREASDRYASVVELERALLAYAPRAMPRLAADADTATSAVEPPPLANRAFSLRNVLPFLAGAGLAAAVSSLLWLEHRPEQSPSASFENRPPATVASSPAGVSVRQSFVDAARTAATTPAATASEAPTVQPSERSQAVSAVVKRRARLPAAADSASSAPASAFDFKNPYE